MLHSIHPSSSSAPTGRVVDGVVVADGLVVVDDGIVERCSAMDDPVEVGNLCQELLDIGVAAVRVTDTDRELRRVEEVTARFESAIESTVENAIGSVTKELNTFADPDEGIITESVERELNRIIDGLGDAFDPDDKKSLLNRIEAVIVEAGTNAIDDAAAKIRKLIDPSNEGGPMGQLRDGIVHDLREPLDAVNKTLAKVETIMEVERGVAGEAERGTQKGFSFEDRVGVALNDCGVPVGDIVERTSDELGQAGSNVGDYVTTADNARAAAKVAWEVKDRKSISRPAALKELNEAAVNREATVAVMVTSRDTKVTNGAPLVKLAAGRYAVVYDKEAGDDLALKVMYQLARLEAAMATTADVESIDAAVVADKVAETRKLLDKVSTIKGDLSSAAKGVDNARNHVDELKVALLDRLDELADLVTGS